jgi:ssRNA-specific RNase YbeY (16S rRNA maturation enzyme)
MAIVRLYELVPVPWLINRKGLKAMVLEIFRMESQEIQDLNIIFCDDEFLLGINKEFLEHDDFTDIITFNLSETAAVKGEIYISVPRVLENSLHQNVPRRGTPSGYISRLPSFMRV